MRHAALLLLPMLAACQSGDATSGRGNIGMANPASVYCGDLGGRLEIRQEPGGQSGYCHLPDGSVVEEWKLFRDRSPL